MGVPTSDILRDRQIADDLADYEILSQTVWNEGLPVLGKIGGDSGYQGYDTIFRELRGGTFTPSPAAQAQRGAENLGYDAYLTVSGAGAYVADIPAAVGRGYDAVARGASDLGSGLATVGKWATVAILGLAVLAVVVAVRR